MKRLAGRRRTIGDTFVEKNTGYWGSSRREARIEHRNRQSSGDWDRACPIRGTTVHVLANRLCPARLDCRGVGKCKAEGASCHADRQSADCQDDHEDIPARMRIGQSQVLCRCHWKVHPPVNYNNLTLETHSNLGNRPFSGAVHPIPYLCRQTANTRDCGTKPSGRFPAWAGQMTRVYTGQLGNDSGLRASPIATDEVRLKISQKGLYALHALMTLARR